MTGEDKYQEIKDLITHLARDKFNVLPTDQ